MKPNDTRDVVEHVIAVFLGSMAAIYAAYLGKKYLDHNENIVEHHHHHIHVEGEVRQEEDEFEGDPLGQCDCGSCK